MSTRFSESFLYVNMGKWLESGTPWPIRAPVRAAVAWIRLTSLLLTCTGCVVVQLADRNSQHWCSRTSLLLDFSFPREFIQLDAVQLKWSLKMRLGLAPVTMIV